MGREATITPEQVAAVADALKSEGKKPTSRLVRERLGNTGSMGTITKLLQRWKAGQERERVSALSLPPALQRAVLDFMDQELAATRSPLEAELSELKESLEELATENQGQEKAIDGLRDQLDQVSAEKASAEGKAAQLTADLGTARDEGARERQAAELARTELAKAQLRLEAMPRLEADLGAVRGELVKESKARVDAEQSAAVLSAQKTDLEARVADAKVERDRVAERLTKTQTRADQLAETAADTRIKLQTAEAREHDLSKQLAAATKEIQQARAEARASADEAAELRGRLGAPAAGTKAAKRASSGVQPARKP